MVRRSCAWLLMLLAASPFTAPFVTCDFSANIVTTPVAQVATIASLSLTHASRAIEGDADCVGPLLERIQVTRGPALAPALFLIVYRNPLLRRDRSRPDAHGEQRPPDLSPPPTVLRL